MWTILGKALDRKVQNNGYWPEEKAREYFTEGYWGDVTIGHLLEKRAAEYPVKLTITDQKMRLTHTQMVETVDRLAVAFRDFRIKNRDRIIIQLANWVESICLLFPFCQSNTRCYWGSNYRQAHHA
jgi:non-ribosomal peptide synthetase component E (peptide arylation enzyme)